MTTTNAPARQPRLVRATEICFIDNKLRQPGDVFMSDCAIPEGKEAQGNPGPIEDANKEIVPQRPKPTRKPTRSASGLAGPPAPEWTTQGHNEINGIQGPTGFTDGRSRGIQVNPT